MLLQLEDRREVAVTRQELGTLARQQGRLEEAHQLLMEALAITRQIKDRQNVAYALKELGFLMQQQGQFEQAVHVLLSAGVGLALVNSPDASIVEERIEQLRAQLGEDAFLSMTRRTATDAPEPAYGLDQAAWDTSIRKLVKQALPS